MKVIVIGAGIGGISTAAYLAKNGYEVTVLEKNSWVGGRIHQWQHKKHRFDMGPSWYRMPAEYNTWFEGLGFDRQDFYEIQRVDPSYTVFFEKDTIEIPSHMPQLIDTFERIEPGSGGRLRSYLYDISRDYEYLMKHYIYKNFSSFKEKYNTVRHIFKYFNLRAIFGNFHSKIKHVVRDHRLQLILEYPSVFLGGSPYTIPALYTILSHVDMNLGTWYPIGGFSVVIDAMAKVARKLGVKIITNAEVQSVECNGSLINTVHTSNKSYHAAVVVANADRYFVDRLLLPPKLREYSIKKWNKMPLSSAVFGLFLGMKDDLPAFSHYNFFFDADWKEHVHSIYNKPQWPQKPLFHVHVPKKTDPTAAPDGHNAMVILVPIAAGIHDTPIERSKLTAHILERVQRFCSVPFHEAITFDAVQSINDYKKLFNAYKGNAFGMGVPLGKHAMFRMSNKAKNVRNLYYVGQHTIPGTGVAMATISGILAAERITQRFAWEVLMIA